MPSKKRTPLQPHQESAGESDSFTLKEIWLAKRHVAQIPKVMDAKRSKAVEESLAPKWLAASDRIVALDANPRWRRVESFLRHRFGSDDDDAIRRLIDMFIAERGLSEMQAWRLTVVETESHLFPARETTAPPDPKAKARPAARPTDLISMKVAISRFQVSRATLRRYVEEQKIRSYRHPAAAKNAEHVFSEAELDAHFTRLSRSR